MVAGTSDNNEKLLLCWALEKGGKESREAVVNQRNEKHGQYCRFLHKYINERLDDGEFVEAIVGRMTLKALERHTQELQTKQKKNAESSNSSPSVRPGSAAKSSTMVGTKKI